MLYVSEDTNKLVPSTLVGQTVWYVAHWCDIDPIGLHEKKGMDKVTLWQVGVLKKYGKYKKMRRIWVFGGYEVSDSSPGVENCDTCCYFYAIYIRLSMQHSRAA